MTSTSSRCIGSIGALSAALLVALSPGAVFMSRYFIHESVFMFAGLAALVAALRYYETGTAAYLMLAFAAFGAMCATKETFIISTGVGAIAAALAVVLERRRSR